MTVTAVDAAGNMSDDPYEIVKLSRTHNDANVRPLLHSVSIVAWLASADCDLTGRVIEIEGGQICLEEGWRHGPRKDLGRRWEAGEVGQALGELQTTITAEDIVAAANEAAEPGAATTPPPGAPPTFGATPAVGPEVSTATFAEAEKLVQVTMTPAQRAMAACARRKPTSTAPSPTSRRRTRSPWRSCASVCAPRAWSSPGLLNQ